VHHLHLDLLPFRDNVADLPYTLGREFGNVDEPFDSGLEFDERAELGDASDGALQPRTGPNLLAELVPRVLVQGVQAERASLRLVVHAMHPDLDRLADLEHLVRIVDAGPAQFGNRDEAVGAAQVHERAEWLDVPDDALERLTFLDRLPELLGLGRP